MNRLSIYTVLIVFLSSSAYSQLEEPIIGKEYNTSKKENFSGFIGESSLALFTADYVYYNKRKQELIIRQFHKNDLSLIDSKDLYHILDEDYTNEPQEIFYQNDKFYLFSRMQSEKDKTELLALEVFDENFERINYRILDTVSIDFEQYIEESEDHNGFVIARHLRFTQLIEQEISLSKINSQGDKAWEKTLKSPMALQNLRIERIIFNEDSPIYILCNYAFDIRTGELSDDNEVNNKYAVWAYDENKVFLKEFELRLKAKWVNGIQLEIGADNGLNIAGYFNETKNRSISGVFSLSIDDQLQVKNSNWQKFDKSILSQFEKTDNNKKDDELEDYRVKNLTIMDDGSFFLLGEQFYKYIERVYDPNSNITTTTEHYNYNSIIASYFDAGGSHIWTKCIPKYQNTTNDFGYFSSFALMNGGDDLYLFFNDSEKNNQMKPGSTNYNNLFNNRRFQISYVHLNRDGIQNRTGLIAKDNSFILRAKLCSQLSTGSIYLITETNRSSKIIKVNVKG